MVRRNSNLLQGGCSRSAVDPAVAVAEVFETLINKDLPTAPCNVMEVYVFSW